METNLAIVVNWLSLQFIIFILTVVRIYNIFYILSNILGIHLITFNNLTTDIHFTVFNNTFMLIWRELIGHLKA